jgi:glutamate carboxypeptidase
MITIEDVAKRQDALLASLEQIVRLESPSTDKSAIDKLVQHLRTECEKLGASIESRDQTEWGDLTIASWPGSGSNSGQILVMTHIDTVWPVGTIERLPWSVEGDIARGPGIFDMKASVAMMLEAMRSIQERNVEHRPIKWLINTEEEMGSPASRPVIEELARESELVLCLEPPVPPHGALKTARKGVGMFTLKVTGKASHAGADPKAGVSAIQELANQIQYLHSLTDHDLGTTVNVGVVSGGTRRNVVAAEADALIDLRVVTMDEAERTVEAIRGCRASLPGATVTVEGDLNRPPMERTEAIAAAFQRAHAIGEKLGLDLQEASTGGASDGNFTAAVGATTIDGLGCTGNGGHADTEHIKVSGLVERTALLTALLSEL